jgi:hypothetical protein
MNAHTIPADALEDPEFRKQMQGLKDVSAALNGQQASLVVFSTDSASVLKRKMFSRHELGLYALACDQEASAKYGINESGLGMTMWRARCYIRGFLDR